MTFDEVTRAAARDAERSANLTMTKMKKRHVYDEDDVTGYFLGSLESAFDRQEFGGIKLSASVLRHRRGTAAEEQRIGADILIHVSMDTPSQRFSKGVLVQAKKSEPTDYWSRSSHGRLVGQCEKMLAITPSAFVFAYTERGIRCGSATRIAGASEGFGLNYLCRWTAYRFFLELFRCPIGDPRISSASVADLPVPYALDLSFQGEFTIEEGASL